MPYATVADLLDRLGEDRLVQLTDRASPPLGVVDEAVAAKALADASDEIDGYLAGRYALPLADAPAVLRVHTLRLAHYILLGSAAGEVEREDAKASRTWLASVASGAVSLLPPSATPALPGVGSVQFHAGSKSMGREASGWD